MLCAIFVLVGTALAGPDAAFAGTWQLDLSASDPVEVILEASGASWLERKAAAIMRPVQSIALERERITITTLTGRDSRVQVLLADDTPHAASGEEDAGTTQSRWSERGQLITEIMKRTHDDRTMRSTITRWIQEGDMVQRISLSIDDAAPVTIERVYRRLSAPG